MAELSTRLYGEPLGRPGVLHVVAVHRDGDGRTVLRIGPATPRSSHDRFALGLSRARVEAIVVTGAILRAEPDLRYELDAGLAAYRRERLGLSDPPRLLVLTSGQDLPVAHPVWGGWARALVYSRADAAPALRDALPDRVEVLGAERPDARGALTALRRRGVTSISIEAGPTTAVPLYDPPIVVDELMLSELEREALPPAVAGGRFLDDARLLACMREVGPGVRVREPSGWWRFRRFVRASPMSVGP